MQIYIEIEHNRVRQMWGQFAGSEKGKMDGLLAGKNDLTEIFNQPKLKFIYHE